MSSLRQEAFFNLKAVVQQTGLNPDTLRAWERRYGLPRPGRSEGGHRLYSQRDIDTVRWLVARQGEGLSISHAVELWEQIEESGQDPLLAEMPLGRREPAGPPAKVLGESLADLRESWEAACLAYDEERAERVLAQAFALYPPDVVGVQVLQETMAQIGEGWYRGQVTVQQEHFCAELSLRHLEALVMAAPPPIHLGRLVAACPPDESHVLGLLLLTLLLRRQGWDLVYLGANVPLQQMENTIAATGPDLVILSAQRLHTAATLRDMAGLLQAHDVSVAYGGLIFNRVPGLRAHIPGHFLGERVETAAQRVEWLMAGPRPVPSVEPVPERYAQALAHFRDRFKQIEATVARSLEGEQYTLRQMAWFQRELAVSIEDALGFGDLDYLAPDLAWVEGLLHSRALETDSLHRFLETFRRASAAHLDERGEPIMAWFDRITNGN